MTERGEVQVGAGEEGDLPDLTDICNHCVRETPVIFDIVPLTGGARHP